MTDGRRTMAVQQERSVAALGVASAAGLPRDEFLVVQDIHKSWGQTAVLQGADLPVSRGARISICGANGTGKTTLLRIASGLTHPDSGTVSLDGLDPERDRRAYLGRLGYLSAGDRGLYARVTARHHLDLWARLSFVPSEERATAVEQAVNVFELAGYADRRVDRLSMGQRQRVRLAMTFVHSPDLILLDEPANSLDQDGLRVLAGYLDLVRDRGGSAVWCVPDGSEAPLAADVQLRLVDGRLQPA